MGLFDRLFARWRRTAPPSTPPGDPNLPGPVVPTTATIEVYAIVDGVGRLRLADGSLLRFGRSACKGFEPVIGASVFLDEVARDPGGWKARSLRLDPNDARCDELLSARDRDHGLPSRVAGPKDAVAAARQLGLVTVLLKDPLPEGTQALQRWAEASRFPFEGVDVHTERDLEVSVDGHFLLAYPGRSPFPKDGLDARDVPPDFDFGRSFIGLGTGLPGVDRQERKLLKRSQSPWGPEGTMRRLSRAARALARLATGVVLHRAGELVVAATDFERMLGDLADRECQPFAAWLDLGIIERNGERVCATFGMDAFGLPDVLVPVDPADAWSRSRGHEAALFACYRMVREDRELEGEESLEVPLRLNIGAWPVKLNEPGATQSYAIAEDGTLLRLQLTRRADPAAEWQVMQSAVALNAYQALFDLGLASAIPSDLLRDVAAASPEVLPHSVEVRARRDGRGFLIVTNGFGRMAQAGAEPAASAHVEVAAWAPTHFFELSRIVGTIACHLHASSTGAWKPGDTVAGPIEELGIGGFVLADGGPVEMGGGPEVRLLLLIPLAPNDYARLRLGGTADWLRKTPLGEHLWAPFLARNN